MSDKHKSCWSTRRWNPEFRRRGDSCRHNREAMLPLHRRLEGWAVRAVPTAVPAAVPAAVGRTLLALAFISLALLSLVTISLVTSSLVSFCCPAAGALPVVSPDWSFEPLGPDGADVIDIVNVGEGGCLLLTGRGDLMYWVPSPAGFSEGMWRPVALAKPAPVALIGITAAPLRLPVLLLGNGDILVWDATKPIADGSCTVIPGLPEGGFVLMGTLPQQSLDQIVAILPGNDDATFALLIGQRGDIYRVGYGPIDQRAGLFITSEDSASQIESGEPFLPQVITAMSAPPRHDQIFLITEWEGLFCSRDGGNRFYPVAGGLPKSVRALTVLPGGGLCASGGDGMFISQNLGRTWRHAEAETVVAPGGFSKLVADPLTPERLFGLTSAGRLLVSDDTGRRWRLLLPETPVRGRRLSWCQMGSELLVATSRGVLSTTDGGANWIWRNRGLRQVAVLAQAVDPASGRLILGTDLGFYSGSGAVNGWLPTLNYSEPNWREPEACGCDSEAAWLRLSSHVSAVSLNRQGDRLLVCAGSVEGPVVCDLQNVNESTMWKRPTWRAFGAQELATSVLTTAQGGVWATGRIGGIPWTGYLDGSRAWSCRTDDRNGSEAGNLALNESASSAANSTTSSAVSSAMTGAMSDAMSSPMSSPMGIAMSGRCRLGCDFGGEASCLAITSGALELLTPSETVALPLPAGRRASAVAMTANGFWLGTDSGLYFRGCDGLGDPQQLCRVLREEGERWIPVAFDGEQVVSIHVASANSAALLCQCRSGIYWTADDGRSWEAVPLPAEQELFSLAIAPAGERIYLGTQHGVFAADPPVPPVLPLPLPPLPIEPSPNPFQQHVFLRCTLPSRGEGPGASDLNSTEPLKIFYNNESGRAGEPIALTAGATEQFEIRIFGINGQLVRIVSQAEIASNGSDGTIEWIWDGRTDRGQEAPNGIYWAATRIGPQEYAGKVVKFR